VTGKRVSFEHGLGDVWLSTFLTQLPAINRYATLVGCFDRLKQLDRFSELDFQRMYWESFQVTGVLNGGIFHCDLNPYDVGSLTGSWTDPSILKSIGYQATRQASITKSDEYTLIRVE
jgi:hypothetical protein